MPLPGSSGIARLPALSFDASERNCKWSNSTQTPEDALQDAVPTGWGWHVDVIFSVKLFKRQTQRVSTYEVISYSRLWTEFIP